MKYPVKILIVEDDMLIAANISMQLTNVGYHVSGIVPRGEEAVSHVRLNPPDIILMDINLKGGMSGIDAARAIQQSRNIPIVYLTANNDEATFAKARETHPYAFISKPFSSLNLQRTIALVIEQLKGDHSGRSLQLMDDRIFVRHNGNLVKLLLDDILYIEAERNYCNIVTSRGKYLVVCTLKTIEQELPSSHFLRVHRSYMVNVSKLDVLADRHVEIKRKFIPVSKSYRELLFGRLHMI